VVTAANEFCGGRSVTVLLEEWEEGGGRAAICSGTGGEGEDVESSGLAIRRPPNVWERLMSPLMASGAVFAEPGRQRSWNVREREGWVRVEERWKWEASEGSAQRCKRGRGGNERRSAMRWSDEAEERRKAKLTDGHDAVADDVNGMKQRNATMHNAAEQAGAEP